VSSSALSIAELRMAPVRSTNAMALRFVAWLLLASILPVPIFAFLQPVIASEASAQWAFQAIILVSTAHVGLSGLFWLDRRYRAHMAAESRTYYWDFLLLILACVVGANLPMLPFNGALVVAYLVWNGYHYARQNWGVLCLAALGTRAPRPSQMEHVVCILGCAGGVLGLIPASLPNLLPIQAATVGFVAVLLAGILALWIAFGQFMDQAHPLRIALTLANGVFFLPIFLFGPYVGFVVTATVHAGHYYVIMLGLAADRGQGSRWLRIGSVLTFGAVLAALVEFVRNPGISAIFLRSDQADLMVIIVLMWHYMLDGGLWRLRQPFQRQATQESLPFLFDARASAAHAGQE